MFQKNIQIKNFHHVIIKTKLAIWILNLSLTKFCPIYLWIDIIQDVFMNLY